MAVFNSCKHHLQYYCQTVRSKMVLTNWKLFKPCFIWTLSSKEVHFISPHSLTPSIFLCGPINPILYYMAHWFRLSNSHSKARRKRFIGFSGWVSLVAIMNGDQIHALVSVCWWIVSLTVVLIIPAVCNGAPVGAGIFHRVRIRALFSSHRGPVETLWFAFSKGWRRCFSSSREALSTEPVSLWLVAS